MYTPKHLKKWKYEENYIGTDWTEYYILLCKTDADTSVLNESNFAMALEELGGESDTVISTCFKHFACGHFDLLLIHESDDKALQIADELQERIAHYPVLDDDDYSERELKKYDDAIDDWAFEDACKMLGIQDRDNLKEDNKGRIQMACLDCMYYHGEAYIEESELWKSLKESKVIVKFSWDEYAKSKGQKLIDFEGGVS